ncbi:MAG TPA: deoxynucleoside kinase, partial [Gammaproteobacteria bacterium]
TMDAPQPDLVIYLQAPVEVLMQRIARRARRGEENIAADYLKRVTDTYARFFYEYTGAPLLIVNAAEIDLASSDGDYIMLLEQIRAVKSGRHYFNPIPSML